MFVSQMNGSAGSVMVETTHKRSFTPEELAVSCTAKIISVATNADPVIRQQAEAFKSSIEQVVLMYLQQTAKSERTTIYNLLLDAGETALAEQIRRL